MDHGPEPDSFMTADQIRGGPDPCQEKLEKLDELGQALVDPW